MGQATLGGSIIIKQNKDMDQCMMKVKIAYSRIGSILATLSVFLASCSPVSGSTSSNTPAGAKTGTSSTAIGIEIYFTDPGSRSAKDYQGGPAAALADAIYNARLSVDMAIYSLNLWSIRDALLQAKQRGVVVRMVLESDNMDSQEIQALKDGGIPVIGDQSEGLMHNKFVVIDQAEVWTGSMNYTMNGGYEDNNNLVRIQSSQVAEDYTSQFEDMFSQNLFGPDARLASSITEFNVNGIPVEVYFSPEDNVETKILSLIRHAKESVFFMAYSFTSNSLGDAVREKATEGVKVEGVMDANQINSNLGSEFDSFKQAGLSVRQDGLNGLMHHKVIIIDQKIVITGSYNFTRSANETNDENVIVIHNTDVADQFLAEFNRIYQLAKP